MRIDEPVQVRGGGWVKKALPFFRWRRPDGLASMVVALIALRKTLLLCPSCEQKMPRCWESRYNYALVKGFHAGGSACDYCPQRGLQGSVNMYCAVDGPYHRQIARIEQSRQETMVRERHMYDRDKYYLLGVRS